MAIDMLELERRVASLEEDRIEHLALISVLVTTTQHLWSTLMESGVIEDPVAFAEAYLADPPPTRPLPGVDPAHLEELGRTYGDRFLYYRGLLLAEAVRVQRTSGE
ncbi:hypothetical protein [Hyphomonas sp.]|uniref:hypothetical protein n=1 Tax=Hyphomonas sp. TaxID=87 RepID=UPI003919C6E5